MEGEQQENLNDIWNRLKNGEFESAGPVCPEITQDDENGQAMVLPLDSPPGGNIKVSRRSDNDDWYLAG
ncbi:MAG TPA: hypothetical protein ENI94_06615 [Gammaproteobacteria bacterium]|nr:hypothetical protein [Gammaproteobacteria bacterium]